MKFEDFIKDILKERLKDYKGQTHYLGDIGYKLTENENMTGSWYCSAYDAEEDIKTYINEFFKFTKWYADRYGYTDDISIGNAEVAHLIFIIESVRIMFDGVAAELSYTSDDKVTLDDEFISQVNEGLDNFTGAIFD